MKIKIILVLTSLASIFLAGPFFFGQTSWIEPNDINNSNQGLNQLSANDIAGNANFTGAVQERIGHKASFALTNAATVTSLIADQNNAINKAASGPLGGTASLEIALNIVESPNSLTPADGVLAEFNGIYCDCVNLQDALKFTNTNETFGLVRDNAFLAIERRPSIIKDDTLFLRLNRSTQKDYQFVFKPANLARPSLLAFLVDHYTGISTPIDITGNTTFEFSINSDTASIDKDRFMVVFDDATVLPVTFTDIKAKLKGKNIAVEWKMGNQVNVLHYEVEKSTDGFKFSKLQTQSMIATGTYNWLDTKVFTGDNFYRVRCLSNNGSAAYSKTVNLNTGSLSCGIKLLQNPVTGGMITLQLNDMSAGKYQVRLLNLLGQSLFSKELNHASGSTKEKVILPANFAHGIYSLEISGINGQTTTLRLINY